MKITLYTRHTCPAKTLKIAWGAPVMMINDEALFFANGKPFLLKDSEKKGVKYEVKVK
jgi:hypothetical protein